ncbi:MAG: flagellar basal-body rod protein FlgG [Deltaproteobacteria bacterium]|nr:flagellar basal-body rod protein FlgG [Deltaproteobacteria bacterium]MCX7952849.1 flagellar basal-body rod protein FlgG [Deltaproteobacteria bacterium]
MIRALYSAGTGMTAQQFQLDTISNNLANANTTGFKRSRANFEDLTYQYVLEPGAETDQETRSPSGLYVGLGTRVAGSTRIFTQGDLVPSSNPFDVAIQGEGFFGVEMPDGTMAYTRSGNFALSAEGRLVTTDGYPIAGVAEIPSNALSVSISSNGTVTYLVPGNNTPQEAGQLTAFRFPNAGGLKAIGKNLFVETEQSGSPEEGQFSVEGFGTVQQGFLESSNVSIVEEIVRMISVQKAYEAASKGIITAEEMLTLAIGLKR